MTTPFQNKPEVLAPAGTLDTVQVVLDAGADAVYLGGKWFNMRMHRGSYNLTDEDVAAAIALCHDRGRHLYFVLNNLMFESELPQLRDVLGWLGRIGPDAIIVQDLATAALAREICVQISLHASTMMNVHSAESAEALKLMGFGRAITSRDIPLREVLAIGRASGLEMEYFVHGDMCVCQSAQCYLSRISLGHSANRGKCMKPCRWQWELAQDGGETLESGYLLARKDMCMVQHIGEMVAAGIVSLKIEGRMRTADFLADVVAMYRHAVDAYFDDPFHYATSQRTLDDMLARKVRGYTTSHALGKPGRKGVAPDGQREPRLFSLKAPPPALTVDADVPPDTAGRLPELIATVQDTASARAAISGGADAIYLAGDRFRGRPCDITADTVAQLVEEAGRVAVLSPRICDARDMAQWRWWLDALDGIAPLTIGASRLGAMAVAQGRPGWDLLADYSLNLCNSVAADEVSTMGAARVTASVELDFAALRDFVAASRVPVEMIAQGPMPGMILEDCLLAAFGEPAETDVCEMPCLRGPAALRDASGQAFPIQADPRCRNHVFTSADVCVLPNLGRIVATGIAGLRVEAQADPPEVVETIVATYRRALDAMRAGETFDAAAGVETVRAAVGRPISDGALAFERCAKTRREPTHAQ